MRFIYTTPMLNFLRENYPLMFVDELTIKFNEKFKLDKSPGAIKGALLNHKIRSGVNKRRPEGSRVYTPEQIEWMRENYPLMIAKDLLVAFNTKFKTQHKFNSFSSALKRYKCICGRTGRFTKGTPSWSKGKKGLHTGGEAGWFKKGHSPKNKRPLGSERIVSGYMELKVAEPNVWMAKHKVVWEEVNGEIPEGMIIHFLDNNPQNCALENLTLITRKQGAVMNKLGYSVLPQELKKTALNLVDLKIKTRQVSAA